MRRSMILRSARVLSERIAVPAGSRSTGRELRMYQSRSHSGGVIAEQVIHRRGHFEAPL